MDPGRKLRISFDAGRPLSELLQPPFTALQGEIGKCLIAAKGILRQAKAQAVVENPSQVWHHWGSFIVDAGRRFEAGKLKMENVLARMTVNMVPMHDAQKSLYACLSAGHNQMNTERGVKHLFDIALSTDQVVQKLDGIPVYTVCNSVNEFVLVSDSNNQRSLGIFCFRRNDAEALLHQVNDREPVVGRGAKVVAVSLNKVYKLNADGIAFRFLPDPRQVKNALEARAQKEDKGRSFDGVPVFQSDNLIVRSNDKRFCPVFFCKEDLELALQRAFKQQQKVNPSLQVNTDIQVGSFEDVLKRMEGNNDEPGWGDVVFIPPGLNALGLLEKSLSQPSSQSFIG